MFPSFHEWLAAAEADNSLHPAPAAALPNTASSTPLPVLVVGAGPAGLCVMAELSRRSVPFVCMEQHSGVGGIWDVASPHSSLYEGLTCNVSKYSMTLEQPWDMPETDAQFPTHQQVLAYLDHYADKHDIRQHCRFGCRVEQAAFDDDEQCWHVGYKVMASGEERSERFADVIAASGLSGRNSGNVPTDLAAQCESAAIPHCHSAAIKQPSSYADKRVLVVGMGFSGSDMAVQLSQHASAVLLSVRSKQYVFSMDVFGQPWDKAFSAPVADISGLPRWMSIVLQWESEARMRGVQEAISQPWAKLGLKQPQHALLGKLSAVDDGELMKAVTAGKVQLRNQVHAFSPGKVHYDNTAHSAAVDTAIDSDDIDSVVFCTGYRNLHPYLPVNLTPSTRKPVHIPTGRYPDLGEPTPNMLTSTLTFLILSPHNRHLYYMTEVQGGYDWLIFRDQARAIVSSIVARRERRGRMERFERVVGFANSTFHGQWLRSESWRTNDELVVDKRYYAEFLAEFVKWMEGDGEADKSEALVPWSWE